MSVSSTELPPLEPFSAPPKPSVSISAARRGRRRWEKHDSDEGSPRTTSMGPAVGFCALSTFLAGVVAYGTHPLWAQFRHGLDVILLSRQLQWPFFVLSLIATLALLATIIAGRRRAWWLLGLAPVLTLFAHRFATDPTGGMASIENPNFVAAEAAVAFLSDDDYVVGIAFAGKNYAYPYAALYSTPVVIHAQHDKRILVMWSAPANRALAYGINRDVRARNLDIVSTPANALLLYDTAHGIFINALTGRTTEGQKPAGFLSPVQTEKTTWRRWRTNRPDTQVMVPTGKLAATAPRRPMRPVYPMPKADLKQPSDLLVALVGLDKPTALEAKSITAAPINLSADDTPVLAFRDPQTGVARAYRCRLDDLTPRFKPNRDRARKGGLFVDTDTNSGWSADGVAVDAKKEFRGKRLPPAPIEDGLYWGVMKHWYPDLQLVDAQTGAPRAVIELNGPPSTKPAADDDAEPQPTKSGTGGITVKPSHAAKRSRRPR